MRRSHRLYNVPDYSSHCSLMFDVRRILELEYTSHLSRMRVINLEFS